MKKFILAFLVLGKLFASPADPIIQKLNSPLYEDRTSALQEIVRHKLIQYIPEVESLFHEQMDIWIQFQFLEVMYKFNSELTSEFALDLIDNTFSVPTSEDPEFIRISVVKILFDMNIFTSYQYIYDYLNNHSGADILIVLDMLKKIAINIPAEKNNVINRYLNIIQYDLEAQPYCLSYIVSLESSIGQQVLLSYINGVVDYTRMECYDLLSKNYDYSIYENQIKAALYNEPEPEYRKAIAKIILENSTPSGAAMVRDYLSFEPDPIVANSILITLGYFFPKKPDLENSYESLFSRIRGILQECYDYDFIQFDTFNENMSMIDEVEILFGEIPFEGACGALNSFIALLHTQKKNESLSKSGWCYFYFNLSYIIEKMNSEEFFCEEEG